MKTSIFTPLRIPFLQISKAIACCALLLPGKQGQAQFNYCSFDPRIVYHYNGGPTGMCAADLDGDGKPDMVTANVLDNTMSVYLNQSAGTAISFSTVLNLPTGSTPYEAHASDIDGDGKKDICILNRGASSISVFRNLSTPGSIALAPRIDIPTSFFPYGMSVGDVDGDGRPDLASTGVTGSTIVVAKNTSSPGSISFAPGVSFPSGTGNPVAVLITDIDGDGKADVAVTNSTGSGTTIGNLAILLNNGPTGTISLAAAVSFPTEKFPFTMAGGDLDQDGKTDIAVVNNASTTLSVFRNTSTPGSPSFAPAMVIAQSHDPQVVSIGELDNDGKPEITVTVANYFSDRIAVLKNVSTPGSLSFLPEAIYFTGAVPFGTAIADFNGDGYNDMATSDIGSVPNPGTVSVFRNTINNRPFAEAGDPVTVCTGGPVQLDGTVGGPVTGGSWSDGGVGGTFSPDNQTLNATWTPPASFTGVATLTLTTTGGSCGQASDTKEVTVVNGTFSCSITSVPASNTYTGGDPNVIYLGYGPQSTTLQLSHTAPGRVEFEWTGNGPLSCTDCESPEFTPAQPGTYTFTCTVTTSSGCSSSCSITICVADIRVPGKPGKVYLCHVPPGNANNPQQLEISVNAVPAHLSGHTGDKLGRCGVSPCSGNQRQLITDGGNRAGSETLRSSIYPNPSQANFICRVVSGSSSPVSVRVTDMAGRQVQETLIVPSGTVFILGERWRAGVYFAELVQDGKRTVVKLVKVN